MSPQLDELSRLGQWLMEQGKASECCGVMGFGLALCGGEGCDFDLPKSVT